MVVTYMIKHIASSKFYIGSTRKSRRRFDRHWRELQRGEHHCLRLQRLWNKCSGEGFKIKVLLRDSPKSCRELEGRYLASRKMRHRLLNSSLSVAYGDTLGNHPRKRAIIARRAETQRSINAEMMPEERASMHGRPGKQNGMYGRTHSRKARLAISVANTGNTFALGAVRSAETRARLSAFASERVGKRNPFFGKHHSAETRERISRKKLGQLPTNLRPVKVGRRRFPSVTDAARHLDVVPATILHRIKSRSARFASYCYLDE